MEMVAQLLPFDATVANAFDSMNKSMSGFKTLTLTAEDRVNLYNLVDNVLEQAVRGLEYEIEWMSHKLLHSAEDYEQIIAHKKAATKAWDMVNYYTAMIKRLYEQKQKSYDVGLLNAQLRAQRFISSISKTEKNQSIA